MRSKIHKETMTKFINLLLDQDNYIAVDEFAVSKDTYVDYFIKVIINEAHSIQNLSSEVNQDQIDFLEKVNLLNLMIHSMDDQHLLLFDSVVRNTQLHQFLYQMIQ